MDEGRHQEGRLFGVAVFNKFDRAVADPLCRMRLCGELADLRDVVHIAALTVVIEDVFVGRIFDIFGVIVALGSEFFLRVARGEAHQSVSVPDVMHLADTAGFKARLREHRVEALALVINFGIIIGVTRAVDVLTREEREARGNANGGGSYGTVENARAVGDRVERGSLRVGVTVGAESIGTALVGHNEKYVLGFHMSLRYRMMIQFNYTTLWCPCQGKDEKCTRSIMSGAFDQMRKFFMAEII